MNVHTLDSNDSCRLLLEQKDRRFVHGHSPNSYFVNKIYSRLKMGSGYDLCYMALLCFGNTELHPHALYSQYADSPPPTQNIKKSIHNDSTGVFRIYFGIFCYYKSQNFLELTRTLYWSIILYTYNISKSWDVSSLSSFLLFNFVTLQAIFIRSSSGWPDRSTPEWQSTGKSEAFRGNELTWIKLRFEKQRLLDQSIMQTC